jgi:PAS domain S-box-containing protein
MLITSWLVSILAKESVFNEKGDERLKVLQVVHDTETARGAQQFWQSVLDALSANIAILDEAGTIVAVNARWRRFAEDNHLAWADHGLGRNYLGAAEAAIGEGAEGALEAATGVREVLAGVRDQFQMEYPCHSPAEERWFAMNVTRFQIRQGVRVVIAHENITARVRAEAELRKLSRAVEQSANAVIITDLNGKIEFVNPALSEISGYAWDEVVGQNPRIFKSGKMLPELYEELWATITRGDVWEGEFLNRRKDGESYWEEATISPVKNTEGKTTHYVAVKEDITARKSAEEALKRQFRYEQAVAACSRTLHRATENQPFDQDILNEALAHLMEGVRADRAYIFQEF